MNDTDMGAIIRRLDQIIRLLELQIIAPDDAGCPHEQVEDIGTMGMPPGALMQCKQCGEVFDHTQRKGE